MGILEELLSNPRATLMILLLALPGRLLAISAHESAHGWVANRCGDPTARLMGRITLNPLKHFDPIGTLCMLLFGFGWAKPVPVNPLNYRTYRRDDLRVSLAGITANFAMFIIGCIVMYSMAGIALAQLPYHSEMMIWTTNDALFRTTIDGTAGLWVEDGWYRVSDLLRYPWGAWDVLIAPVFGQTIGYLYQMIYYFVSTNLVLAAFNLIPVPPLAGYHVVNDLVLKRPLFADRRAASVGRIVMLAAVYSGWLDKGLNAVYDFVLGGGGQAVLSLLQGVGLF